ncbi:MAG TPA: histidinol-phosphate transaminase [Erysipelotrichaceae bacterium]|nr:histidinol-phosphate transaminase [Erysipelotrichaceae bacterium]
MENKVTYQARQSGKILLNANESGENLSAEMMEKVIEALKNTAFNRYPENTQKKLREAYAAVAGVNADQIIAGNGSDQLLGYLIGKLAGVEGTIYTFDPDFSMYDYYASSYGSQVIKYPCDEDGSLDIDSFIRYGNDQKADLVIFSNPNNPSGHCLSMEEVETVIQGFDGTPVIVDEAYIEFADETSAVALIEKYPQLYVTRTLSKAYGLAGMRVGFAIGQKKNMDALREGYVPYALSTPAMEIACAVLSDPDAVQKRIEEVKVERKKMLEALKQMKQLTVYDSQANFIYGRTEQRKRLCAILEEEGIVIRLYGDGNTFRITVSTSQENSLLMEAFHRFEGEKQ